MKPWMPGPKEAADMEAAEGFTFLALECATRWLRWWRQEHPDDDRSDYDLIMAEYR